MYFLEKGNRNYIKLVFKMKKLIFFLDGWNKVKLRCRLCLFFKKKDFKYIKLLWY